MKQKNAPGVIGLMVMASGRSSRFPGNKLLQDLNGKTVIENTLSGLNTIDALDPVVLTRYPEVESLAQKSGVPCLLHSYTDKSDTIRLGFDYGKGRNWEACIFLQGDQPLVSGASIQTMIDTFRKNPDCICRLSFHGQMGAPVLFPKQYFSDLCAVEGNRGGHELLQTKKTLAVEAASSLELFDIDTKEDLLKLQEFESACLTSSK